MNSSVLIGIGLILLVLLLPLVLAMLRRGDQPPAEQDESGQDGDTAGGGRRPRLLTGGWLSVYAESVRPEGKKKPPNKGSKPSPKTPPAA